MQSIIARRARPTDLADLSRLWYEKMLVKPPSDAPWGLVVESRVQWQETIAVWLLDERCAVFVAESDGDILGYIIGSVCDAPPGSFLGKLGFVSDIALDMHRHQSGAGRVLLNALREHFSQQGIQRMVILVSPRFAVEQAFWRSQGATEWMDLMWLKL